MKYKVKSICYRKIFDFYLHVAKKYKHTYSSFLMHKNIDDAVDAMYGIEVSLLRRTPTLKRWQDYHMAHSGYWYYAYTINGDTITIVDVCHEQNMHE